MWMNGFDLNRVAAFEVVRTCFKHGSGNQKPHGNRLSGFDTYSDATKKRVESLVKSGKLLEKSAKDVIDELDGIISDYSGQMTPSDVEGRKKFVDRKIEQHLIMDGVKTKVHPVKKVSVAGKYEWSNSGKGLGKPLKPEHEKMLARPDKVKKKKDGTILARKGKTTLQLYPDGTYEAFTIPEGYSEDQGVLDPFNEA